MEVDLQYRVEWRFSEPVREHHLLCRIQPCAEWSAAGGENGWILEPQTECEMREDCWGQSLYYAFIPDAHTDLTIDIHGRFSRTAVHSAEPGPEWCAGFSVLTAPGPTLLDWAGRFESAATPLGIAWNAARWVHNHIEYRAEVTGPATPAEESATLGVGVCQDMVQASISLVRMRGVRARYVAGFVPGEGQSHAWMDVWSEDQWHGIDPTRGVPAGPHYLAWARGRDAADCRLDRGVFSGGGTQTMSVTSKVVAL
ncbi:MAG TPA: transglutaminase family protein [Spirochaetia bacterium]|nr:transglutaminase family protein [Spirochaetia bacterium]